MLSYRATTYCLILKEKENEKKINITALKRFVSMVFQK